MELYTYSRQKGTKNHCYAAQVWKSDETSLCYINATVDENEASETAELICRLLNEYKHKKPMRDLTNNQKRFLLDQFFKNEKYPFWESIAIKLLETGECVVAGDMCIWIGGIGNFIKTENSGYVGCLKYFFDLELFLSSEYFNDFAEPYNEVLIEKKREYEDQILDLHLLTKS